MGMTADHQIIRRQITGQVFLLVCHINPQPAQFEVQEQRKLLRPFLIIISPYNLHRRDLL